MPRSVFLSYSRANRDYAEQLAGYLTSAGVTVWWDFDLSIGDVWAREIERHIDKCAAVVVVLTPAAAASAWVHRELSRAVSQGKPIVPVLLENCDPPLLIADLEHEDVRGGALPGPRLLAQLRTKPVRTGFAGPARPLLAPAGRTRIDRAPMPVPQLADVDRRNTVVRAHAARSAIGGGLLSIAGRAVLCAVIALFGKAAAADPSIRNLSMIACAATGIGALAGGHLLRHPAAAPGFRRCDPHRGRHEGEPPPPIERR